MITRARAGVFKPHPKYALAASTTVPVVPQSVRAALKEPAWRAAMQEEFDALHRNQTRQLVPRPCDARVISGKWVFKVKTGADGSFERNKARWVVHGDVQRPGIDFGETFSPVIKPATMRTVLTIITTSASACTANNQQGLRILPAQTTFVSSCARSTASVKHLERGSTASSSTPFPSTSSSLAPTRPCSATATATPWRTSSTLTT
jgi:hypothetical protein